jgi:hypothetical protein
MSAEKLEQIILAADDAACRQFFEGMEEAERRALAPLVGRHLKTVWETYLGSVGSRPKPKRGPEPWEIGRCAGRAAVATATLSELKRLPWWAQPFGEPGYLEIVRDRRPPWLRDWCDWILEQNFRNWGFVRAAVREGLCAAPETEIYVLGMIDGLLPRSETQTLIDRLQEDPEILRDLIWRLFEVEGGGELSLAAYDKYGQGVWSLAFLELAERGLLDRGRLLDASLDALARDFAQFRAGWFSRLHESLQPSLEERQARLGTYLTLLRSPIPPTVSFTLKALQKLHRAKALPGADFVAEAEPLLYQKGKGTVKAALKIVGDLAKADPVLAPAVASLSAVGLEHPDLEVQEAALSLLERYGDSHIAALRTAVADRREVVAASLRPRLAEWIGESGPNLPDPPPDSDVGDLKEIIAQARALPAPLRKLAAIDELLTILETSGDGIPAVAFDGTEICHLSEAKRIAPLEGFDAVLDHFLQAIETPDDARLVERLLDGLARLPERHPPDFDKRTQALAKRSRQLHSRIEGRIGIGRGGSLESLISLAAVWLGVPPLLTLLKEKDRLVLEYRYRRRPRRGEEETVTEAERIDLDILGPNGIFLLRIYQVAEMVAGSISLPLLSAATHHGGRLAPMDLVARSRTWQAQGATMGRPDQVLALLRLAPDDRAGALASARDLTGEWGAALRHALGGQAEEIGSLAPLWAAAARARAPFCDDPAVMARFPDLGPGAGELARLELVLPDPNDRNSDEAYYYPRLLSVCAPPPPEAPRAVWAERGRASPVSAFSEAVDSEWPLFPSVQAGRCDHTCLSDVVATLWPLNPEFYFTAAALESCGAGDTKRPASEPLPGALALLLDPDQPMTPMARALLGLALGAKDEAEGAMAADLMIAALGDGRLDAKRLGEDFAALLFAGLVLPKRWATRLQDVTAAGPLAAQGVRRTLETILEYGAGRPAPPGLLVLLELLHELCLEAGEAVASPAARSTLAGITGSGKAARLAKALLALEVGDPGSQRRAAAADALVRRVERGLGWAGRQGRKC